jgi:hypothetical protein
MSRIGRVASTLLALLAAACAAGTTPGPREVPKNLNSLESLAEDGFDMALAGDVAGVKAASSRLTQLWPSLRETVVDAGAQAADVAGMDGAIADLSRTIDGTADPVALARAANAVSLHMDALFDLYAPAIPSAVLTLDFLGREVLLDGMQNDFSGAAGHSIDLAATWKGLREKVVGAGGAKTADFFDGTVAALRGAVEKKDSAEVGRLAIEVLDDVDILEAVF